jgi:hypothetical protein
MNALDLLIAGLIEVVTKFLFDIGFKDAAQQIKQSNLEEQIIKVVDQSIKNITIAGKKHNVEFNINNHFHFQVVSPYIHEAMRMSGSFIVGVADAQPIFPNVEPYIQKLCEEDYE